MPEEQLDDKSGASSEARYVNCFKIGYNALEFVFDFGQDYSGGKPQMTMRLVMNSAQAKAFYSVLRDSIDAHERTYALSKDLT